MMNQMYEGGAMMGWFPSLIGLALLILLGLGIAALIKYLFGKNS